jgi:hypothetical protein
VCMTRWRLRCSLRKKDLPQSGFVQTNGPDETAGARRGGEKSIFFRDKVDQDDHGWIKEASRVWRGGEEKENPGKRTNLATRGRSRVLRTNTTTLLWQNSADLELFKGTSYRLWERPNPTRATPRPCPMGPSINLQSSGPKITWHVQ